MINIRFGSNLGFDLSTTDHKSRIKFFYFINLFKNYNFVPKYKYYRFKRLFVIKCDCKIITKNNITNEDIAKIKKIYQTINVHNININYLDFNIPFLRDKSNKNIYFFNYLFLEDINTESLYLYSPIKTKLSNKYVFNKFLIKYYDKNIELEKNYKFYVVIYGEYDFPIKIIKYINKFLKFNINIRFVLFLRDEFYDKFLKYIDLDDFNKYMLIRVEDKNNNFYSLFTSLKELKIQNFDYIYFIKYLDKINLDNVCKKFQDGDDYSVIAQKVTKIKTKTIYNFIKKNRDLNNIAKGQYKCITDYTIKDIDVNSIKIGARFVSKDIYLKSKNKIHFEYNFLDGEYPNSIELSNSLFEKSVFTLVLDKLDKIDCIDDEKFSIFISLVFFYYKIRLHC